MLKSLVAPDQPVDSRDLIDLRDEKLAAEDAVALSAFKSSLIRSSGTKNSANVDERGTTAAVDDDQLHIGGTSDQIVNPSDLLRVLSKDQNDLQVLHQKFVKRSNARKPVDAPVEKIHAEKNARKVAYQEISKEVEKWDAAVFSQKTTDQVFFPLNTVKPALINSKDYVESSSVGTALEKKIEEILGPRKPVEKEEEDLELAKLEELVERRNRMAKFRAQQSYFDSKMKRMKKIKSRSFRRVLKKERLKKLQKEFEELKETNPEVALKKLEALDKKRVEERMTLKHRPGRTKSKWSHMQAIRAKYDPEARKALAEQLRLSKQLTTKVALQDDSDEEDIIKEGEEEARKEVEPDPPDPWTTVGPSKKKKKEKPKKSAKVEINPADFILMKPQAVSGSQLPDEVNQGDDAMDDDEEYGGEASLVAEAFAGDDVVADFQKEKEDVKNAGRPKREDRVSDLPGWGEWGGKSIVANPDRMRRKRKHVRMPSPPPRKDDSLGNVIVAEKGHESARAAQVSQMPFPYVRAADFEASIRMPLGTTWIPETSAKDLRKPRIVTKAGAIIEPMDEHVLAPNKKRRKTTGLL